MKLLHIDASILGDNSVSRRVSAAVVARLRGSIPDLEVSYRDLGAAPLLHLTGAHLAGNGGDDATLRDDIALGGQVLQEFLDAAIVVIGAPMYNFGVPSQLKAWIDRILVAGKTFRYGANGVEGLAAGKRVILALSRGGFYGTETGQAAFEHVETYLRSVFAFVGITDPEIVAADGVALGPEQREAALAGALRTATTLRAA